MMDGYEIVRGSVSDWELFNSFHYRSEKKLYFVDKVYLLLDRADGRQRKVGIAVYTYPMANCRMRDTVLSDYLLSCGYDLKMKVLNNEVRRLARVVINPQYQGRGLAAMLVSRTMSMLGRRFVEVVAKNKKCSGFLQRAGLVKVREDEDYYLYDRAID